MRDRFASERLAMRPFVAADAEPLHAGYRDADLMRWWSTPPHADVAETRAFFVGDEGSGRDEPGADGWQGWTVTLDGEPIGTLSAGRRRAGVYEITYLLVRGHWGRGYGREMVARLVDLLVAEEGARRLQADVDPDNGASLALLERLGFRREGLLRAAWATHVGVRDSVILGLLAEEWHGPARPAAPPRPAAALVAPVGLMGLALAVFGLALAVLPRVPRAVAGAVLAVALAQLVAAAALRRRA